MKKNRSITFRKVTRAFYLLGVVFLLAGMFLSVANIPAQAGSLPDGAAQATRLPPSNPVKPPSVQPPAPKPPVVEPISPAPGNPGSAPQGPGAQNLNRGPSSMATPALRGNPSILATMAPGASVSFTQADYCYDGPAGLIEATVVVTLPENVSQARLSTDWYVVWPRTGDIVHHYFTPSQVFEDGDTYTFSAEWPGIDAWTGDNTVEIHFGAQLIDVDLSGPISEGDGLDVYYNGRCDERPPLQLTYVCQDDGSALWTLANPNSVPVAYSYTVNGQPGGSGSLTARSSTTFTTPGGATVVVTFDDGLGGSNTLTVTAEDCGVPELEPLTLDHSCTASGITWTVTNPNDEAVNIDWDLDDGDETGSLSVPPNSSISVVSSDDTDSAHSLTVIWTGGSDTDTSAAGECSVEEAVLVVLHECIEDTNTIQWQVRNTSSVDTTFTWALDGGAQSAPVAIDAGETVNVTTSSAGAHTLVVTWSTGTATGTSEAGFCVGEEPPVITLSHDCADEEGYIDWFATNESDEAVEVEWSLDGGEQTGTVTIAAGETVELYTSIGGEHTMQVTYAGDIVVTDSSVEDECGIPFLALTLDHACTASGITWTVNNPNGEAVDIDWDLDEGAQTGGPVTVPPNGSITVVSTPDVENPHTLTITWDEGSATDESEADECAIEEALLEVLYACIDGTETIQWQVRNTGTGDTTFRWSLDGGAQSALIPIAAGATVDVTTSSSGAHTLTITWDTDQTASATSDEGFCTIEEPPAITLDHACADEDGYIEWFATNDSDEEIEVEWSFDDGDQTGTVTIEAGETVELYTSVGGEHTMQVTYDDIVVTDESVAEECGMPVIEPLSISYACVLGENTLTWTVTNTNDFALTFNWALDSGAWSTDLVVAPNSSLSGFTTSTSTTAHVMQVRWYNAVGGVDGEVERSSPAEACVEITPTPPPSLNLQYVCIGTTTNVQWTAVNDGNESVGFTWTKDVGQADEESGSDTVPANGERDFLVTNNDAHTVTITWSTETGSLSVSRTSPAGICDVTTTTVTVTPPTTTVTTTPGTSTVTTTPGTTTVTTTPGTSTATTAPGTSTVVTTPGTSTPETSTTGTPDPGGPGAVGGGFQGSSTPGATSTPIATVGVPITGQGESAAVSPATGGDLSRTTGMALWQQILFNGGLLFLGLALIFEGLGRKFR